MALKILSQIGTDRGITSEAYVRISQYNVNKVGCSAIFNLSVFLNQADSVGDPLEWPKVAKSQEIGDQLSVSFSTEEGCDLSSIEGTNIFSFGYGKLKEKLVGLYGAQNVIDC